MKSTVKSKRSLLAAQKRAHDKRMELYTMQRREQDAAATRIREAYDARQAAVAKELEALATQLRAHNPCQVGDRVRWLNILDHLPSGSTYEITNVVDHEVVIARLVTTRGSLGASARRFNMAKSGSWALVSKAKSKAQRRVAGGKEN